MLDLLAAKEIPPESPGNSRFWLEGDRLAWLESDGTATWLVLGGPGESPRALRGWRGVDISLSVSPDRKLLLARTGVPPWEYRPEESRCRGIITPALKGLKPEGKVPEEIVYEVASGRWIELPWWPAEEKPVSDSNRVWAGPRTLARTGPGYFALEDVDRPGVLRPVIGRATD
jgi:hypothetical protein